MDCGVTHREELRIVAPGLGVGVVVVVDEFDLSQVDAVIVRLQDLLELKREEEVCQMGGREAEAFDLGRARHKHVAATGSTPLHVSCCLSNCFVLTYSMSPDCNTVLF